MKKILNWEKTLLIKKIYINKICAIKRKIIWIKAFLVFKVILKQKTLVFQKNCFFQINSFKSPGAIGMLILLFLTNIPINIVLGLVLSFLFDKTQTCLLYFGGMILIVSFLFNQFSSIVISINWCELIAKF